MCLVFYCLLIEVYIFYIDVHILLEYKSENTTNIIEKAGKMRTRPLIYVYLGKQFPDYGYESIEFSIKNSNLDIILLTNSDFQTKQLKIDLHSLDFYVAPAKLDNHLSELKNIRNGFWTKTLERFHVLEQFCKQNNINEFVHIELDNIAFELDSLINNISKLKLKGIFLPRESNNAMIASLFYCNNLETLEKFNSFSLNDDCMHLSEMYILSHFQDSNKDVFTLPSVLKDTVQDHSSIVSSEALEGVVDGILFGLYLFGKDPTTVIGTVSNKFIRASALKIPLEDFKFGIEYFGDKSRVYVAHENQKSFFYNFHIHSKIINKNISRIDSIILRLNLNKKTLIMFNFLSYFKYVKFYLSKLKHFIKSYRSRSEVSRKDNV